MNSVARIQKQTLGGTTAMPLRYMIVQRQCACGGSPGLTGDCSECRSKNLLGKTLQTKLRINEPGDVYEQEAHRMAPQMMQMPVSNSKTELSITPTASLIARRIAAGDTGFSEAPSVVHDVLSSPGRPLLDDSTHAFFEPCFRYDFGSVRVHTGRTAADSAATVHAHAYTVGDHIVMATENYTPESATGRRLLSHELTHADASRKSFVPPNLNP